MIITARFFAASAFVATLATACSAAPDDRPADTSGGSPSTAAAPGSWYEILRTGEIRGLLDTSRIERVSEGRARVWFRFVYTTPMTVGTDTARYRALEVREDVDCPRRQTRELEMRFESVTGASAGSLTPDAQWGPIDTHPMNSGVFLVACRTIGHPLTPRGAPSTS
jgi:hypothetical protein